MAFQKGQIANPNGGKRPRMVSQQIIAALNETAGEGATKLRKLVDKLIELALGGDMQAINAVMDRAEGKPPQLNTADASEFRKAMDLSDDELATIATRSSDGAAEAASGSQVLN